MLMSSTAMAVENSVPESTKIPTEKVSVPVKAPVVAGCPEGYICATPEQLVEFVNQQIYSRQVSEMNKQLNDMSNQTSVRSITEQYQDVMKKKDPPK